MDIQDQIITIFCLYYALCVGTTVYYLNRKIIIPVHDLQSVCEKTCFVFSLGLISPVFIPFYIATNCSAKHRLLSTYSDEYETVVSDTSDDDDYANDVEANNKKNEEDLLSEYVEIMRATL